MGEKLDLEVLVELGKFTNQLKANVKNLVVEGAKVSEIINYIEGEIFKKGYLPAFPCTVCINDIAAHYTIFNDDIDIKKSDLVKVDFGVSKNGFVTDTAFTVEIGTDKYKDMIEANLDALNEQLESVDYGTKMFELGKIPELKARQVGCNTIHNLSGHQVERNNLHAGLHVPNYDNNDSALVKDNMALAIEPYFSSGSSKIKNGSNGNILHLVNPKPVRDVIAKRVLAHIENFYPHLPFSKRWLLKDVANKLGIDSNFNINQVVYAINLLKKYGIVYEHDVLISTDGSVNSQFEETVVFVDNRKVVITRL